MGHKELHRRGAAIGSLAEGDLLWEPSQRRVERVNITRYLEHLRTATGRTFASYDDLWRWSIDDLDGFWSSLWNHFDVTAGRPFTSVLADRRMPGARWFPDARLNYADYALRRRDERPALIALSESGPTTTLSYAELAEQTAAAAAGLRRLGVGRGDRVVAYLPNVPATVVAFLATASVGAVWSCCSPEFGARSVIDRFGQVEPRVLLAANAYRYNGKRYDRMAEIAEIQSQLRTLTATVIVPGTGEAPVIPPSGAISWADLLSAETAGLACEAVPFDAPLWILYSSGTTGLPKAIVHGHGGILLEHLKTLSLHLDLGADDRFLWYTTTGWMMWNLLVSGLLVGSTVVLYDGSPNYPDLTRLWRLAEDVECTYLGTSGSHLQSCMKAGLTPGKQFDLSRLRGLGATGSPLSPDGYGWVYSAVSADVHLGSISGGTDVCTGFVGPCPTLPVHAGEIQCRALGASVHAYDETGTPVVGAVGELVVTAPLPSMPLGFWSDPDGHRYRDSYFAHYPGVWRHGDWIKITDRGSCVIYGRSDSTLNRGGVRMGTSDFYRVVEELPEVIDSLVVDTGQLGTEGRLVLFLVLQPGIALDKALTDRVRAAVRMQLSPRHVPDEIHALPEIPRTRTGKKLEVPVRRILQGASVTDVVSTATMSNPDALQPISDLAARQQP